MVTRSGYVTINLPAQHEKLLGQVVKLMQRTLPPGVKATKGAAVVAALEVYKEKLLAER